ncbi:hypothetical protein Murru_3211 [Allomuricauda ruestringensis DSM 13258]|uniref:Uncharacterized protein n=1 Tax=Allomuricauda ruestringensis (strain DSM 13258 / CIP 107369 / LMG 19739 / B1) TaxID=886377 RepID=G2PLW2_ALLRU|nr:hypothetical protein Murru_3211 [Allomuricauda ruestringensis DSM 13258]
MESENYCLKTLKKLGFFPNTDKKALKGLLQHSKKYKNPTTSHNRL